MLEHTPLMTVVKPKPRPASVATHLSGASRAGSLPAAPCLCKPRGASSAERDLRRSLWGAGSPPARTRRALFTRPARASSGDLLFRMTFNGLSGSAHDTTRGRADLRVGTGVPGCTPARWMRSY